MRQRVSTRPTQEDPGSQSVPDKNANGQYVDQLYNPLTVNPVTGINANADRQ